MELATKFVLYKLTSAESFQVKSEKKCPQNIGVMNTPGQTVVLIEIISGTHIFQRPLASYCFVDPLIQSDLISDSDLLNFIGLPLSLIYETP